MNRIDTESRLDTAWQAFISSESEKCPELLEALRFDLLSEADSIGILDGEDWSFEIDDLLYGLTSIGTLARQSGHFDLTVGVHRRICEIAERWFTTNWDAFWYFVNSSSQIGKVYGCQCLSRKERECLLTLQLKMHEVKGINDDVENEMVQSLKEYVKARIAFVDETSSIDPELMLGDARVIRRQRFEASDPETTIVDTLSSDWPRPDFEHPTAAGTFDEGEMMFVHFMNESEAHLGESEEKVRSGELTGALEESNAALATAEATSATYRGAYGARLTFARAIQERARVLEKLGLFADSLRERSLAEGVLQDAILAFPQVPELLFTLSWIQSQLGAAKFRLEQSTSETVAHTARRLSRSVASETTRTTSQKWSHSSRCTSFF